MESCKTCEGGVMIYSCEPELFSCSESLTSYDPYAVSSTWELYKDSCIYKSPLKQQLTLVQNISLKFWISLWSIGWHFMGCLLNYWSCKLWWTAAPNAGWLAWVLSCLPSYSTVPTSFCTLWLAPGWRVPIPFIYSLENPSTGCFDIQYRK